MDARTTRTFILTALAVGSLCGRAEGQRPGRRVGLIPSITSISPPGAQIGATTAWTIRGSGFAKARTLLVGGGGVEVLDVAITNPSTLVATLKIDPAAEPGFREVRLEGPDGASNLMMARIDSLPQVAAVEPDDAVRDAKPLAVGTAVAGTLVAADLDHYRIEAKPGTRLTLDLEMRRLGTALSPVLTVMNLRGAAIRQAREDRSPDRDCRLSVIVPAAGALIVQVRDNTYSGSESAFYRLRVTTEPFATAMFPLGGPSGEVVRVTASGESLTAPVEKAVRLPDDVGAVVDPGGFAAPGGIAAAPGKLAVGDRREILENPWRLHGVPIATPISAGETANGRIARRGEVDRYILSSNGGKRLAVKVDAERLGSFLDSTLIVRDLATGDVIENDDDEREAGANLRRVNGLGLVEGSSDSRIEIGPKSKGPFLIEVTDRFGDGGLEFGYRLSVGAIRNDFTLQVLAGNPSPKIDPEAAAAATPTAVRPPATGAFNLVIGAKSLLNFVVVPDGRPGPVTVSVEGLPEGVTVEPVKVDFPGPNSGGDKSGPASSRADNLVIDVASYAYPGLSEIRVVATAEPVPGRKIRRVGTAVVGVSPIQGAPGAQGVTHRIDRFPLRLLGETRPRLVGPPTPPQLVGLRIPGVLLQGDRLDVGLEFDQSPATDPSFEFDSAARGVGLATNSVVVSEPASPDSDDEPPSDVVVRVLAGRKVAPGVYPVSISYKMAGRPTVEREISVIVRAPIETLVAPGPIRLRPGGKADLRVMIRRELGADVPVDVKLLDLPPGVTIVTPVTLAEGQTEAMVHLEMNESAKPIAAPQEIRVVAVARMPRGLVEVESKNRPTIVAASADERG